MLRKVIESKDGSMVQLSCSRCGIVIYSVFVLSGDTFDLDWGDKPSKCLCGAQITEAVEIIRPIIDDTTYERLSD